HATVTVTIPPGMRYVADSAAGPGTDIGYSIDGGASFAEPDELNFGQDSERRLVAAEFYTDIRWTMRHPLAPAATGYARFRAVAPERARQRELRRRPGEPTGRPKRDEDPAQPAPQRNRDGFGKLAQPFVRERAPRQAGDPDRFAQPVAP
ncbi:MAG TPA: hypothetical protein VM616_04310, partial [Gammaproteobacteria bacterium]|nr:hypothetical protein [Gammaproteobacteria bacterium]